MKYSHEIDSIKTLSIIGVIFAHMYFSSRFQTETLDLIIIFQNIFGFCVIGFFFASAYLVKDINSLETLKHLVKKRFIRLVIPSIVFSVTYKCILFFINYKSIENININFQSTIEFFLLPISPQFYFLYYLFIISILFSLLLLFTKIEKLFYLCLTLFILVYFFIEVPIIPHGGSYNILPFYIIIYCVGLFMRTYSFALKYTLLISFIMIVLSSIHNSFLFIYVLVPILLFILFKKYEFLSKFISSLSIGRYSGSIYVFHAPILMPFLSIIITKLLDNILLVPIALLVLTILISVVLHHIVYKFDFFKLYRF
jgi:hypothetical protein